MECILYKGGYKYQLKDDYVTETGIVPSTPVQTLYIGLTLEGRITIKAGYAWDGPSGPTIDTLDFMRGSLVHDALYQLIREGHLEEAKHREPADRLLQKICIEDGMSALRAWWVYQGVRLGGGPAADPANEKPMVWAPFKCK
jgi:hypothetical protein